jgi:hypothetical protein
MHSWKKRFCLVGRFALLRRPVCFLHMHGVLKIISTAKEKKIIMEKECDHDVGSITLALFIYMYLLGSFGYLVGLTIYLCYASAGVLLLTVGYGLLVLVN